MRLFSLRFWVVVLAGCQIFAMAGCVSITGSARERLAFEGRDRSYLIHVPASYDANNAAPLVVALHGADMAPALMPLMTNFNALSNKEGFIVVYPKGLGNRWNSGLNVKGFPGYDYPVDDVGFVSKVIDDVERAYRIDPRRVYVTGVSNGGMLTHMVACGLPDRIAAGAPVIGTLTEGAVAKCPAGRPIPILMVFGMSDPVVKWEGGALLKDNQARSLSVNATVDFWVRRNGCDPKPETVWLPHRGLTHMTRVRHDIYKGKSPDSDVVLYAVEGGGHTWPGGPLFQLQCKLGRVNHDLKASKVIWQFFKEHPKTE
jgi:polyhydroxybutyrate depolymerase